MPGINLPARVSFPGGKRGNPATVLRPLVAFYKKIYEFMKSTCFIVKVRGIYLLFCIKGREGFSFSPCSPSGVALLTNGGVCYLL
jgi:hypothetical protein